MFYRAIFRGNLQFGNARSFERAMQVFTHRVDNLYKGDVLLKAEDIFVAENFSLILPSSPIQGLEKSIKNTAYLLEALAQYALSGQTWSWMVLEGKCYFYLHAYPSADKTPVMAYVEGLQYVKQPGQEQTAIEKLSVAIDKFSNHWTALERRGYVYMLTQDYDNAIADFERSIKVNTEQADAYSGLARIYMQKGDLRKAVGYLDYAIKNSVPYQSVYWQSRRIKGECLVQLNEYDKAEFELKICVKREFEPNDSNYAWRKNAMFYYSQALLGINREKEAKEMFVRAVDTNDALEPIIEGKQAEFYTMMLGKVGRAGGKTTSSKNDAKSALAKAK